MRGRTNAEPNIGVQLNASVDTYEVATGETILAGDFVEQNSYIEGQITAGSGSTNQYPIYECWDKKNLSDYLMINLYMTLILFQKIIKVNI